MKRQDFRHLESLRVRWAEVDAQQVVFNGHYLMYVDTALAGWWRALAVPYPAAVLQMGGDLYVRKATLEYEAAARHDDRLSIGVRCSRIGRSSMHFQAAVFRDAERLVLGELVYVFADPATMRSQPVPPALRTLVEAFEAGEAMLRLRFGDWSQCGAAVRSLREAMAGDDDPAVVHAVAFSGLGDAVACGRMRIVGAVAYIDARTTSAALRGAGHGRVLLNALHQSARERGCDVAEIDGPCGRVSLDLTAVLRSVPGAVGPVASGPAP